MVVRIIPARAGFTALRCGAFLYTWDHPRSRGVYGAGRYPHRGVLGSSPLARGLPQDSPRGRSATGIIPARAGFTALGRAVLAGVKDHPRSRGVYTRSVTLICPAAGSSPLARGLQGT